MVVVALKVAGKETRTNLGPRHPHCRPTIIHARETAQEKRGKERERKRERGREKSKRESERKRPRT